MRADILGPECDRLWIACIAAAREGGRAEADAALAAFVAVAVRQPPKRLDGFAQAWCVANLDGRTWAAHRHGAPVRLPLLREIIGPALMRGHAARAPGCARWLAGLWSLLDKDEHWRDRLAQLGGPEALLDEALALDPADGLAHAMRSRGLVASIGYRLHELPWIIGGEAELRDDLDRLTALGPGQGQDPDAFGRYVETVRAVLEGDRSDAAFDEYTEAEWRLKERA